MSRIQNVAIIGASGALGKIIIPHLLSANFTITIISRPGGHPYYPPPNTIPIKTLTAAYDDLPALTSALQNQDALIEAYNPSSTIHQRTIIRAALAAGIKHLITNEFGTNTFAPNGSLLPAAAAKITAQRVLEEELEAVVNNADGKPVSLSWTGIITSTWFDWAIRQGAETFFWVNPAKRTITRYGSGDQKTCLVHEDVVGQAVVTVLQNPEKYKNRPAYFASYNFSTNEMISIINEIAAEDKVSGKWDDQNQKEWEIIDIPDMEGFKEESLRLWDEDRRNGVTDWLHTKAFVMQVYAGFFDEKNFFGFDFGDRVEPGWLKGRAELKESLRGLIEEVGVEK
ncbi:hypothetical protein BCR34DRAFT_558624 [Clohesyomyces aquaticus]|uniref:NmrA-like domain-containing protein n=1 Tax=Clohesyomyces aquaticus TaxID=1231657 RepID=A0A1Y1ZZH3_9PLEO|nr:hypothetical protein BCR34DRAFT_558624 [Clohesyomyces aquaticus]